MSDDIVAYVTVDGVTHGVMWDIQRMPAYKVLACTGARAPLEVRSTYEFNQNPVNCITCVVLIAPKRREPYSYPYRCNVPMCGESGVCDECRKRGAR